jgi:hypothetical protein
VACSWLHLSQGGRWAPRGKKTPVMKDKLLCIALALLAWAALPAQDWETVRLEDFEGIGALSEIPDFAASSGFLLWGNGASGAAGDKSAMHQSFPMGSYLALQAEFSPQYEYRLRINAKTISPLPRNMGFYWHTSLAYLSGTPIGAQQAIPYVASQGQAGSDLLSEPFSGLEGSYWLFVGAPSGQGSNPVIPMVTIFDDFALERRLAAPGGSYSFAADSLYAYGGSLLNICLQPDEPPAQAETVSISLVSDPHPHFSALAQPLELSFPAGSSASRCLTLNIPADTLSKAYDFALSSAHAGAIAQMRLFVEPCPGFAGEDRTICAGECVMIGCPERLPDDEGTLYCYSWVTLDGTEISGAAVEEVCPSETTTYVVRVTDNQGDLVAVEEVTIEVRPSPLVDPPGWPLAVCKAAPPGFAGGAVSRQPASGCPGSSITLDAGSGAAAYLWSTGEASRTIEAAAEGYYYVTVTAENGCRGYGAYWVAEEYCAEAPITASSAYLCPGEPLEAAAGPGFEAYSWSDGSTGPSITVAEPGLYYLEAATADGCLAYGELEIEAYRTEITPARASVCDGETLTLEAEAGQAVYLWSDGSSGASIQVGTPGLYAVTVTNPSGCALSHAVAVDDCCDLGIVFGGQTLRHGQTAVFTPQNVEFGIVFLELYDMLRGLHAYTWEINGRAYVGDRIALRVIDFFPSLSPPYGNPSSIKLTSHEICPQTITITVDASQIAVQDYLPPEKMVFHVESYLSIEERFMLDLDQIAYEVGKIYDFNGINWIDFVHDPFNPAQDLVSGRLTFNTFSAFPPPPLGNTNRYRNSFFNVTNYPINYSLAKRREWGYIISHEILHQILARIGYLCFGDVAYLQTRNYPNEGPHIDQEDSDVAVHGINLNTAGSVFGSFQSAHYAKLRRIYPVQLHYAKKILGYSYLLDADLIKHLSPFNFVSNNYAPQYEYWKEFKRRMDKIAGSSPIQEAFYLPPMSSMNPDPDVFNAINNFKF